LSELSKNIKVSRFYRPQCSRPTVGYPSDSLASCFAIGGTGGYIL